MKLPVQPKDSFQIIDKDDKHVCFVDTMQERDFIVKAINGHEKLKNACEKAKWLYDELALSSLGVACKYGDNYEPPTKEDCLKIRELLKQALKEAENTK